jgi:hypothetical protein
MANDVHSPPEPSLTALVSGIIHDIQELLKQQVTLFRYEFRQDLRKAREAGTALAAGVAVALGGGLLLLLALPLLLSAVAPALPLWAWFAIVGAFLTGLGALLAYAGVKKLEAANPLHDQSVEALKENVQWLTNQNPK